VEKAIWRQFLLNKIIWWKRGPFELKILFKIDFQLPKPATQKMLNPAFHFGNLRSIVSIMVDQTAKAIDELLLSSDQQKILISKE
jgi:hypothetical protein